MHRLGSTKARSTRTKLKKRTLPCPSCRVAFAKRPRVLPSKSSARKSALSASMLLGVEGCVSMAKARTPSHMSQTTTHCGARLDIPRTVSKRHQSLPPYAEGILGDAYASDIHGKRFNIGFTNEDYNRRGIRRNIIATRIFNERWCSLFVRDSFERQKRQRETKELWPNTGPPALPPKE